MNKQANNKMTLPFCYKYKCLVLRLLRENKLNSFYPAGSEANFRARKKKSAKKQTNKNPSNFSKINCKVVAFCKLFLKIG